MVQHVAPIMRQLALIMQQLALIMKQLAPLMMNRLHVGTVTAIGDESISSHTKSAFIGHSCQLTLNNFINISKLNGIWLALHSLVYMTYSFIVRERLCLYFHSILWEIIGYLLTTFKGNNYTTPPLLWMYECPFDRIIIDILLFNLIGIEIGLLINKIIYNKYNDHYQFKSFFYYHSDIQNVLLCRHNVIIFIVTFIVCIWYLVIEVAHRFIIAYAVLNVTELHFLILFRHLTALCLSFMAIKELNHIIQQTANQEFNVRQFFISFRSVYLLSLMVFLESIICLKFYFW
eukprot:944167_1